LTEYTTISGLMSGVYERGNASASATENSPNFNSCANSTSALLHLAGLTFAHHDKEKSMEMDDTFSNTSDNQTFEEILSAHMSRRGVLVGGLATAALTFFGGSAASAASPKGQIESATRRVAKNPKIGFTSIPLQSSPMPTIAPEYRYSVLAPWREKLDGSGKSYPIAGFTAEQQEKSVGIGHDGMWYFGDEKSGLLCVNHEYGTTQHIMGKTVPQSLDDVRLSQAAHGMSVIMIEKAAKGWKIAKSDKNRRIHVNTPAVFTGPAAKSDLLKNAAGNPVQGTLNNCANGYTPWGTYLTCEENFNGYFGSTSSTWKASAEQARYGFTATGFGYDWHKFDPRFDLAAANYANEMNRFGWVVEVDPNDPKSKPAKRTALGRVKHEGAEVVEGKNGRVVVYMGDDERFDYVYKFVSKLPWKKAIAAGKSPLDEGTLYVAKFNEDGTGRWLELSAANPALAGWTLDKILVNTRGAADLAGATKMDRPEWITTDADGYQYVTLTNNTQRGTTGRAGVDKANPTSVNTYGHIVRWMDSDKNVGTTFTWEIFALAKDVADAGGQMFGSPDGIWADKDGRVFVQTDGEQPGKQNDQMLVANAATKQFSRLFTGVKGCEVTGVAVTPSQKTMFVNVQHPGDGDPRLTNFPAPYTGAGGPVPRDCTIVITRKNGGVVGT
jgi:secreted PhoX family phosphatase